MKFEQTKKMELNLADTRSNKKWSGKHDIVLRKATQQRRAVPKCLSNHPCIWSNQCFSKKSRRNTMKIFLTRTAKKSIYVSHSIHGESFLHRQEGKCSKSSSCSCISSTNRYFFFFLVFAHCTTNTPRHDRRLSFYGRKKYFFDHFSFPPQNKLFEKF